MALSVHTKRILLGLIPVAALVVLSLSAGSWAESASTGEPETDLKVNPNFERRIDLTEEGLVHAVDLWYDAIVKDDLELSNRYERLIVNIFHEDIWASEMEINKARVMERQEGKPLAPDLAAQLESAEKMLRVKQKLLDEFQQANTYAQKYRYLGGYINSLRKELGMPRLELAYLKHLEELGN